MRRYACVSARRAAARDERAAGKNRIIIAKLRGTLCRSVARDQSGTRRRARKPSTGGRNNHILIRVPAGSGFESELAKGCPSDAPHDQGGHRDGPQVCHNF